MERITDWIALWRQLVERRSAYRQASEGDGDSWKNRARKFDAGVKARWSKPDSSRTFLLSQLREGDAVLDIGAGTGRWTVLMAPHVARVTAVEPSAAMGEVLHENLAEQALENVEIVSAPWPETQVGRHDVSLCAHAMYMTADFPAFIGRMVEVTARTCFLLLRAPVQNGVMAQAAQRVWEQPYDSPNFVVAYNALLQMGILANVLIEDTGVWGSWANPSLEDALRETKEKLGLEGPSEHDAYLRGLLEENLTLRDGEYVWPPSMRSALVYWDIEAA